MTRNTKKKRGQRKRYPVFIDPQYAARKVFVCDFDHNRKRVPQPDFKNLNSKVGAQPVVRMYDEELKDDETDPRNIYRRMRKVEFQTLLHDAPLYKVVSGSDLKSCDPAANKPKRPKNSDEPTPETVFTVKQIVNYNAKAKNDRGVVIRRKHIAEVKDVRSDGKYGIRYKTNKWEGREKNSHSKFLLFQPKKDPKNKKAYFNVIPINGLRDFKRALAYQPDAFDLDTYQPEARRTLAKLSHNRDRGEEEDAGPTTAGIFRNNKYSLFHDSDEDDAYEDEGQRRALGKALGTRNRADETCDFEEVFADDSIEDRGHRDEEEDLPEPFSSKGGDESESDDESETPESAPQSSDDEVKDPDDDITQDDDVLVVTPRPTTDAAPEAHPPAASAPTTTRANETLREKIVRVLEQHAEKITKKDFNRAMKKEFPLRWKQKPFKKTVAKAAKRLCLIKNNMLILRRQK